MPQILYYLFSLSLRSWWWVQIVRYVLACRSYPFVCTLHHFIIITVQTYLNTLIFYSACQIYFVECVSKISHILSVIHYTIYGAVFFQFTHFPFDDWENIYPLSYYHHQIGSMNCYPLFRVRSRNNGMLCMSFYIFINGKWGGKMGRVKFRGLGWGQMGKAMVENINFLRELPEKSKS